jgi:hypothetical protein
MPKVLRQLAPVVSLLVVAGVLAYLSPKLGLFVLVGVVVGLAISWIVAAGRALRLALSPLLSARATFAGAAVVAIGVAAAVIPALLLGGGDRRSGFSGVAAKSSSANAAPARAVGHYVPVTYIGHATFHPADSSWAVRDRIDVGPQELQLAAAGLLGPLPPISRAQAQRVVGRYMRRPGWAERQIGETVHFVHTTDVQGTKLAPWWRLTRVVRIRLRTTVPDRQDPLFVAAEDSKIVLDAPARMVRATFPPSATTEDTLENRELVTIQLGTADDSPPAEVRVKATNAFGRSPVVAWALGVALTKWTGWTTWALGALGGIAWNRRRRLFQWLTRRRLVASRVR